MNGAASRGLMQRASIAESFSVWYGPQLFGCSGPKEHTLISPFETPVNIICEAINPVPLLRMFFGGRHYGNDFRLPGNAMLLFNPHRVHIYTAHIHHHHHHLVLDQKRRDCNADARHTARRVCFVQLHEWWICITLGNVYIYIYIEYIGV